MLRSALLTLAVCFIAVTANAAVPLVVETDPLPPEQERLQFHLPPGFEIELIIADPDIGQPMNMNFDAHGRLWLTHVLEYPYPARGEGVEPRDARWPTIGEHEPRDKLSVIENVGTPQQKITHFATGLNIPIGNVPTPQGVVVFSIPDLWFCPDADGDLHADSRDPLYGRFGNLDTHGMVASLTRWIDGWIYSTHGFRNTSHIKSPDGHEFTMNSGNTFRFKEDGSRIEQFTWGQVNPFGLTFDPWGNAYTADCHSMPLTGLIRGAYYSSFGKPHDGLGFGPDMIDHIHGSTGICGAQWYEGEQFPEEYRGCIFLCNPVNGIVHRDRIEFHGSSPWVVTQPEFISCDDGWFRPVDVKLGPDGALYIADFYNCIIGHYEVALDHPRRSRDKGRIWKITYHGDAPHAEPPAVMPDLSRLSLPQLVDLLTDTNFTTNRLATNELYDRFGAEAIEPCTQLLMTGGTPQQTVSVAWILERLGALPENEFKLLLMSESDKVRTHAARILAERASWLDFDRQSALQLLDDPQPMVRRAAADSLGRHPQSEFVPKLIVALEKAPADDPFLRHTIRIALRDHLLVDDIALLESAKSLTGDYGVAVVDVALGAPTEQAANLLAGLYLQGAMVGSKDVDRLRHIARYATAERVREVCRIIQRQMPPISLEPKLLPPIIEGLEARNADPREFVGRWATGLVNRLFAAGRNGKVDWSVRPLPGRPLEPDTFVTQSRDYAGGSEKALFHSSLPGGERKTGIFRSEPFQCPRNLTFFLAGHDGVPENPPQMRNVVRLTLAETGEVIASAAPPRNDLAQKVEWQLADQLGQRVQLEIIDGDDAAGYAWLAAGNFSLPALNPVRFSSETAAAELITRLHLDEFNPRLAAIVADESDSLPARIRWAGVLLALNPDARLRTLVDAVAADIVGASLTPRVLAAVVSRDEAEINDCLTQTLRSATAIQQRQLAEQLSADRPGSEALIKLTTLGISSPRLLLDPRIAERVRASIPDGEALIGSLVEGLPEPAAEIEKLIADRRQAFSPNGTTSERGLAVFKQHCAACHQLGTEGKKVGPVLDGIGLHGADRLFEDILDPSRNVDAAFRTTTILNKQGQVLSGLLVREEGATLILVDNKGKEFSVPKADVDEQTTSGLSLMPGNWGEIIPPADVNELIAELLRQVTPAAKAE